MKKPFCIILLATLFTTATGWTQSGNDRNAEATMIDAERQLQSARNLSRLFNDRQAEGWIRQAQTLFDNGRSAWLQRQFQQAQKKFLLSLGFSQRVIDLLSKAPMSRSQEQVKELLQRAEQTIPASGDKEAERLLSRARENLRLAQRSDYQKRGEYLRIARFLLEQSLEWVEGPKGTLAEKTAMEKNRFEELLLRSQEALSGCQNERAQKLFLQAQKQTQSINQALHQGEYKLAISFYNNTTRLLLRVIDLCQGRFITDREQTLEELEFFSQMLETAKDQFGQSVDPGSNLILRRAARLQQQAVTAVNADECQIASRRIELARSLLSRLWNQETEPTRVEQEITRLQSDLESWRSQQKEQPDSAKRKVLWRSAEQYAQEAVRLHRAGHKRAALMAVLVADRFLNLTRGAETDTVATDAEKMEIEMDQVQEHFRQLPGLPITEENQDVIRFAQTLYDRAQSLYQNQQYPLALQYCKMSRLILDKINP